MSIKIENYDIEELVDIMESLREEELDRLHDQGCGYVNCGFWSNDICGHTVDHYNRCGGKEFE